VIDKFPVYLIQLHPEDKASLLRRICGSCGRLSFHGAHKWRVDGKPICYKCHRKWLRESKERNR